VILALWRALAQFMERNGLQTMIGCASIPIRGAPAPADVWHRLRRTHLADARWQVRPWLPLPVGDGPVVADAGPPALVKGYLRLGAKVLGPPAWDPDFHTADLPMMMRMADLPPRYLRNAGE
jgi:putative hemolysin